MVFENFLKSALYNAKIGQQVTFSHALCATHSVGLSLVTFDFVEYLLDQGPSKV